MKTRIIVIVLGVIMLIASACVPPPTVPEPLPAAPAESQPS